MAGEDLGVAATAVGALDEAPVLVVEFGEVGGRVARLSGTAVEPGVDASGGLRRRETASTRSRGTTQGKVVTYWRA